MAFLRDFLSKTETITAVTATVATFDKGVPAGPFRRLNFKAVGANNSIAGSAIDYHKVKLEGVGEIWNVTPGQLRALLEAYISPIGGSVPATSALRWTLPFDLYNTSEEIGLPAGRAITVEIGVNTNASAGSLALGWEFASKQPRFYPRLVREQMGAPASSSAGYNVFFQTGAGIIVPAIILPLVHATQGIQEMWLYRATKDNGPVEEVWHGEYLDILESQAHYNPEAITNPFVWKPPILADYPKGSYLKVKTGTSSAETDEWVPLQLMPA